MSSPDIKTCLSALRLSEYEPLLTKVGVLTAADVAQRKLADLVELGVPLGPALKLHRCCASGVLVRPISAPNPPGPSPLGTDAKRSKTQRKGVHLDAAEVERLRQLVTTSPEELLLGAHGNASSVLPTSKASTNAVAPRSRLRRATVVELVSSHRGSLKRSHPNAVPPEAKDAPASPAVRFTAPTDADAPASQQSGAPRVTLSKVRSGTIAHARSRANTSRVDYFELFGLDRRDAAHAKGRRQLSASSSAIGFSTTTTTSSFGPPPPRPVPRTLKQRRAAPLQSEHVVQQDVDTAAPTGEPDVLRMQLSEETGKLMLVSGTVEDVWDCLTIYVNMSSTFLDEVLFTMRYFSSPQGLMDGLRAKYIAAKSQQESVAAMEKRMTQLQERVNVLIHRWIENHSYYFDDDDELVQSFTTFVKDVVQPQEKVDYFLNLLADAKLIRTYAFDKRSSKLSVAKEEVVRSLLAAGGLLRDRRRNLRLYKDCFVGVEAVNLLMRKLRLQDRQRVVSLLASMVTNNSIVSVSKYDREFSDGNMLWRFVRPTMATKTSVDMETSLIDCVLEIDARTLAEQLTRLEFEAFQQITPTQMANKAWTDESEASIAKNVLMLIDMFNDVSFWVATSVVEESDQKRRAEIIAHWIHVAEISRSMNNFNTMMEVLVGLMFGPVQRLKQTWAVVPTRRMATLEKLNGLVSNSRNHYEYRKVLKQCKPPAFPYLGLYLKDLFFIEDANDNFLDEAATVVNWEKMRLVARVFTKVQRFQQNAFRIAVAPRTATWFKRCKRVIADRDELYTLSHGCEAPGYAT